MTYKSLLLLVAAYAPACFGTEMERDTLTLGEFTLTGEGKSAIVLQPLNVSIISESEITESAESSLLPIMSNNVAGLFVSERGYAGYGISSGSAGAVNIRGVGQGNKVLFMIDGAPQWAGIYGHSLADVYATNGVERIDVIKGPASLLYGSNAMGGAINIITKRAANDGCYGRAQAMIGSFATQNFSLSTGSRRGKWQVNGAAQLTRSNGNRAGSEFWAASEYAQVQYSHDSRYEFGSMVDATQSKSNYPGTLQSPLEDMWTQMYRYTVSAYAKNHFTVADGGIRAYINLGKHKISDGHAPDVEAADTLFRSKDYNLGISLYQTVQPWHGNSLSVGASLQHWGGHITNGLSKRENEVGAYALMQQNLWHEKLSLNGGVRLQHGSTYGNVWTPQAGFTLRAVSDAHLRFSFAKGFRAPNIRELYLGEAANSALLPEHLYSYEVELRKRFFDRRLDVCIALFYINAKDMIQTVTVDGRARNENTGSFRNKGFEVDATWGISEGLSLSANYSYLHTTSRQLLAAPKNKLNAELCYRRDKATITLQSQSVWSLYTGGSDTESYTLVNARIAYGEKIVPMLKVDNITNKHYEIIYGCPMPGITVIGGVTINF